MGAFTFLLPDMLFQPRFEIEPVDPTLEGSKAARVAEVLGYLMFPDGVCNMITTVFFFMPLKKRFGEVKCITVAGLCLTIVISLFGFVENLWALAGLMCIKGCCGAFMLPVAAPLAARYSQAHYPDSAGQVQAIPALGISFGATLGQSVVVLFKNWVGIRWAWVICSCCILVFVLLTTTAIRLIDSSIADKGTVSSQPVAGKSAVSLATMATGMPGRAFSTVPRGLTYLDATELLDEREAYLDPISFAQTSLMLGASRSTYTRGRSRAGTGFSRHSKFGTESRGNAGRAIELS